MLAAKRSAGVAPEVNLRNPLHIGEEVRKQGIHLALKPRADITRNPKQGCKWLHKKDMCTPKIKKKFHGALRTINSGEVFHLIAYSEKIGLVGFSLDKEFIGSWS